MASPEGKLVDLNKYDHCVATGAEEKKAVEATIALMGTNMVPRRLVLTILLLATATAEEKGFVAILSWTSSLHGSLTISAPGEKGQYEKYIHPLRKPWVLLEVPSRSLLRRTTSTASRTQ